MYGFHGRLLHVDMSTGKSSWVDLEETRLRAFLGGIGLGACLLYEYAPAGVDPFSPGNPLIFASAPLVGTGLTTTAKYAVVTKSPLTGFIADSLSSSYFALELKRIGIDALILTGRSNAISYLSIKRSRFAQPNTCAARVPLKPNPPFALSLTGRARGWPRSAERAKISCALRPSVMKAAMPAGAASVR
jgi:hypothetical protein